MGEFVEQSLEALLPVFEQLSHVHIFKEEEVTALVKRCRRYEYRLQKRAKSPDDFLLYANYLNDVLVLIKSRRARNNYWHKLKVIDKSLAKKISGIYWACCERYQGNLDHWKKLFSFLDKHHMMRALSTAYTRALQVHGRNIELRREAALWEFFRNASADNARTQLQLALRIFPSEPRFFIALFTVELHFVKKIIQRRKFLEKKSKHDLEQLNLTENEKFHEISNDAVLDLKVAEIVMGAACKAVSREQSGGMFMEMWRECRKCLTVPNVDRLQMDIEGKLRELNNEDTRIMEIEIAVSEGKDIFDAYDEALGKSNTERMYRMYLSYCEEPTRANDPFSQDKSVYLIRSIVINGWAGPKDFEKAETSINVSITGEEMELFYKKAIEYCPSSNIFWTALLRNRIKGDNFTSKQQKVKMFELFNQAFQQVPPDDSYAIWELALDFTIQYAPEKVEKLFSRAYCTTPCNVASRLKIIRLNYCDALTKEGKLTPEDRKNCVIDIMRRKPNSVELYSAVASHELSSENPDHSIIQLAWDTAVSEHATDSTSAWIGYASYAMKYNPTTVSKIYKRAMLALDKSLCSDFITEWTRLIQAEAKIDSLGN